MKRALIDTNVVLDVLFEREDFLEPAKAIWKAVEDGRLDGYVSAVTPITIFYVAHRQTKSLKKARQLSAEVLDTFRVCALTEAMLHAAMNLPFDDYEDAAQTASAQAEGLDFIITRDAKDYEKSPVKALTPAEFVAQLA
ncbi:MAG: PIN domain-containing protein [Anaerolineales bacterium]|jgi:predicted nucleic acid-binding protein|nr:PIN domain-containing protein [Anaerolineales bacterium]